MLEKIDAVTNNLRDFERHLLSRRLSVKKKKIKHFYLENNFLTIFYITDPLTCLEIGKNC